MDPPNFGRGAKGEVWKIENHFLTLLDSCKEILSELPQFVLINGYAAGYSALGYENALKGMMSSFKGNTEVGEVVLVESQSKRILPSGIFARWFTM
jgi:23S rRNA (cytosine1962-C5)-methyltransferase